jgi:hypothetical protein
MTRHSPFPRFSFIFFYGFNFSSHFSVPRCSKIGQAARDGKRPTRKKSKKMASEGDRLIMEAEGLLAIA